VTIDQKIQAVLTRLEQRDRRERETGAPREVRLRQVSPEVGRFLHTLVLATEAQSIVEIGTSGGYSTLWLAAAARAVGGHVTTLEIDSVKVATATETIADAGLVNVASVVSGDAFAFLKERAERIDFCFLDAEKEDYEAFFDLAVPLLARGGVLVADNITSHAEELAAFVSRALSDDRLSAVAVPIGLGELLAVRLP